MVAGLAMQIATRLRRWARLEIFDDQAVRVPDRRIATVGDGAQAGQARGAALLEPRQEFVEGIDVGDPLDMAHGRQAIFAGT